MRDGTVPSDREAFIAVNIDLQQKLAAFCREAGDGLLEDIARGNSAHPAYKRVWTALRDNRVDATLETDLDRLNDVVRQVSGRGFYPEAARSYTPLPGASQTTTGACWWTCPVDRCSGYGRVKPGQSPPICAASGSALVSRPLL
jgi:hypothetical protein